MSRLSDRSHLNDPASLDESQKAWFAVDARDKAERIASQYPGQHGFLQLLGHALLKIAAEKREAF